ncbi:MAG: phosphatidate cytidylyltransferase [Planctomycetota bacterium]
MLKLRVPFGIAFVFLLVGVLWLDGVISRAGSPGWFPEVMRSADGTLPPNALVFPLLLLLGVMVARELVRILRAKGVEASTGLTCALAVLGLSVTALSPSGVDGFTGTATAHTGVGLVLAGAMVWYARDKRPEGLVASAGGALLAYAFIGVLLGFLAAIRREHSEWVLLYVIAVTKACDTGAFFTGRAIGKHKLAPWLSPGKTWEGLWGGVAFSSLVGGLGAWWLSSAEITSIPVWAGVVMGAVFALLGQAGDLVASLLKRDAGRKDAGSSVPGFGGVLDLVDSLLLVGPVAFWSLRFVSWVSGT